MGRPVIVFHTLDHARAAVPAAIEANVPVTLRSAPDAAAYAGAGYLKAIADAATKDYPKARVTWVIDCGADAGTALGALRIGWQRLRFSGADSLREKLTDIAAQRDATVTGEAAGETVLDLLEHHDPCAACRDYRNAKVNKAWLAATVTYWRPSTL